MNWKIADTHTYTHECEKYIGFYSGWVNSNQTIGGIHK